MGIVIDPAAVEGTSDCVGKDDDRSNGDGQSMGAEWASPRLALPPARADPGGERDDVGAAHHDGPRPRRDHRPRVRRGRAEAGAAEEGVYKLDDGLAEWVRRWSSTPAWLYLPHLEGRKSDGEGDRDHAARRGDGILPANEGGGVSVLAPAESAAREIRGRGGSLGPNGGSTSSSGGAEGQRADDSIRGPLKRPGPTGARGAGEARARVTDLEAWLQRSRAERAARASDSNVGGVRNDVPTAAERLAALRRRVSARAAEARSAAEDLERNACMGPTGSTASTEDEKMHLSREGRIHGEDPTYRPVVMGAMEAEKQSDGGGNARAAVPSSDAVHAAQLVAWHAVARRPLTHNLGAV